MPVTCEQATLVDISYISRIVVQIPLLRDYGQSASQLNQLLTRAFERHESVRIARDTSGMPSGIAWFLPHGAFATAAYLRLLLVSPDQQGTGVGQALLEDFEYQCKNSHGGYFALTTDHNGGARGFYARRGYTEVGMLQDFVRPGANECLLWKRNAHFSSVS